MVARDGLGGQRGWGGVKVGREVLGSKQEKGVKRTRISSGSSGQYPFVDFPPDEEHAGLEMQVPAILSTLHVFGAAAGAGVVQHWCGISISLLPRTLKSVEEITGKRG